MIVSRTLASYKSILCLNGDIANSSIFNADIPIIATDGAANKLISIGVEPEVIIGDLDSIESKHYPNSTVIYLPNQNKSDFQKALEYIVFKQLLPTLVVGVNGGFLDHILNNLSIIIENNCHFYAPPIMGYVLKSPYQFTCNLSIGTKLSLFGMHKAIVRTNGLKWELNEVLLEFPGYNSSLNRSLSENILIEVLEGTLLLLIYDVPVNDNGLIDNI